ncbi:MAG TPA: hypothetical protein VND94_00625 [Terriglobia bacterium]|nr:hypothetical protein [Terriglobia bacterium]
MERIARVAIRTPDGYVWGKEQPMRHHDLIHDLSEEGYSAADVSDQGFMTDSGRFVDRSEGLRIAIEAGQIVKKNGNENELYSEDMW